MKKETKELIIKYLTSLIIASAIALVVFCIEGFFTSNLEKNLQILSDGFSVSGFLLVAFAGVVYISGEGAFIGIGFILRNVILTFVPMGRSKQELYADYRERKLAERKMQNEPAVFFVGLVFLAIGLTLSLIWLY